MLALENLIEHIEYLLLSIDGIISNESFIFLKEYIEDPEKKNVPYGAFTLDAWRTELWVEDRSIFLLTPIVMSTNMPSILDYCYFHVANVAFKVEVEFFAALQLNAELYYLTQAQL